MTTNLATSALPEVALATGPATLAWLLILLPLAGAAVLLIGGQALNKVGAVLGCLTVLGSFGVGLLIFFDMLGRSASARLSEVPLWNWIGVGNLQVELGLRIDPLSMTFVLLITGVGALIHCYSIGYMAHDSRQRVFFAYLNLFVAAMLLLVLSNSFVGLYAGWEGVGLASYLLIGFWHDRPSAATAAKKAFLMNRVGDVGLAIAIFLMWSHLGTTSFTGVFAGIATVSPALVTAIALLLLLGACGKSGQVPLQAWLPDAMEGPTPVSALIHAATMVTAGVYLIARSYPVFDLSPTGRLVVIIVGTVTLVLGAIAGCAKDDIKKVLAYSTVSQIGYMFLAVGLGAGVYALGIMHLLTHGFFKAGLFLGAGSVMHAMNDDVDMRRYGGLARKMPITFGTMALGYLALIGFPFLSGFFSKDPIIEAAFAAGGVVGWVTGLCALGAAGLTAFYMTRLMVLTFLGKPRWKKLTSADGRAYHPHESPALMTVPMIVLAVGSIGAGVFLKAVGFVDYLAPAVGPFVHPHPPVPAIVVTLATVVVVFAGIALGYLLCGRQEVPVTAPATSNLLVRWARADVGGNAVNEYLVAKPAIALSRGLVATDDRGVDGAVNGLGSGFVALSELWRRWQNGFVRSYALSIMAGTIVVTGAMLLLRWM